MISNQILQNTIDGLKGITRIDYYSAGVHGLILVRMDRQSYDVISQY